MWAGDKTRVPRGVNSSGFFTLTLTTQSALFAIAGAREVEVDKRSCSYRLCVGVIHFWWCCRLDLELGVETCCTFRLLLSVVGISASLL